LRLFILDGDLTLSISILLARKHCLGNSSWDGLITQGPLAPVCVANFYGVVDIPPVKPNRDVGFDVGLDDVQPGATWEVNEQSDAFHIAGEIPNLVPTHLVQPLYMNPGGVKDAVPLGYGAAKIATCFSEIPRAPGNDYRESGPAAKD
jgi:hypothetical protein